jgi:hypothetical protein
VATEQWSVPNAVIPPAALQRRSLQSSLDEDRWQELSQCSIVYVQQLWLKPGASTAAQVSKGRRASGQAGTGPWQAPRQREQPGIFSTTAGMQHGEGHGHGMGGDIGPSDAAPSLSQLLMQPPSRSGQLLATASRADITELAMRHQREEARGQQLVWRRAMQGSMSCSTDARLAAAHPPSHCWRRRLQGKVYRRVREEECSVQQNGSASAAPRRRRGPPHPDVGQRRLPRALQGYQDCRDHCRESMLMVEGYLKCTTCSNKHMHAAAALLPAGAVGATGLCCPLQVLLEQAGNRGSHMCAA